MLVREQLLDNGVTRATLSYDERKKGKTLVVTFANLGDNLAEGAEDKPSFGEKLFVSLGCRVLAFQKRRENWYQDLTLEDCAALVEPLRRHYPRVVTYGSSMGAYAALYFSGALKADMALAISPQCSVDPLFPAPNFPYLDSVTFTHGRIREVSRRDTRVVALFDPLVRRDRIYLDREIRPAFDRVEAHAFRFSGHPTGEVLAELKLLKDAVVPLVRDGTFDRSVLDAAYRAARRGSIHYFFNLTQVALEKRRPALALRCVEEGFRLYEQRHAEKPNAYVLGKLTRVRDRVLARLAETPDGRAAG